MTVFWGKNGPVAATDNKEAERLNNRIVIIDKVLKEMGIPEGYIRYAEIMNMWIKDMPKYMKFLDRVDELSK